MRAPKLPSFFNSKNPKEFIFKPRYYDERKERIHKKNTHINKKIKLKRQCSLARGKNHKN